MFLASQHRNKIKLYPQKMFMFICNLHPFNETYGYNIRNILLCYNVT